MTLTKALRIGVVGCGVGRAHIHSYRALPDLYDVRAVCDIDADKLNQVSEEFAIPITSTDYQDLCQQQDLDIIDICTPPYQHYQQILDVLDSGKHVICEKPLVSSLKEVDQLLVAEKRSGRRVMPILQYRYGHGLQKLKFLVDQGIAGELYMATVEMAWRRRADYYAAPWRGKWATELGGTLLNHSIHHLDMLTYIAGPVRNVFARTAALINPIEVEDCGALSLEMKNGSLATLSATLGSTREISRHRFCFSHLTAESNSHPYQNSDDPWTFTGDTSADDLNIAEALSNFQPGLSSFEEQFTLFQQALAKNNEPPVTLTDARNLLEIMTAAYASAQTKALVELPIQNDHPKYSGWAPEVVAAS